MKYFSLILFFVTTILSGNGILSNYDNRFEALLWMKSEHSSLQDALTELSDSTLVQSYPARALLRSLVFPGWGQMYNKSPWWKTALFAGIEVAGIVGIVQLNKKAENLRLDFEAFADEHWNFSRWIRNTPLTKSHWTSDLNIPDVWNYNGVDTTMYDVIIDGTHSLSVLFQEQLYSTPCFNDTSHYCDPLYNYEDELLDFMQVVRDLHFYENIGKYDQFVGGWDDLGNAANDSTQGWWIKEKRTEDGTEILIMTRNKDKYLDMRYESDTYLKMATYAVSAVMFNHVISALEAVWTTQSNARHEKTYDTSIGLYYNKNTKYGIGGLSFAISW